MQIIESTSEVDSNFPCFGRIFLVAFMVIAVFRTLQFVVFKKTISSQFRASYYSWNNYLKYLLKPDVELDVGNTKKGPGALAFFLRLIHQNW